MPGIPMDLIKKGLPSAKEARMKLFDKFDPNGNGILSLAEIEKGLRDVMKIDSMFNAKPAIMRAYKFADKSGNGFIGKTEFRLLLEYLDHFFKFWKMFEKMDKDDDRKVSPVEFRAGAKVLACLTRTPTWSSKRWTGTE